MQNNNGHDALKTLQFEDHDVRILIDDQGEPWFVLGDVLDPLGLTNVTRATERLDDEDLSSTQVLAADGKVRDMKIVNEPGLYTLILGSRKPEARAFKKWVTSEVLPSIRKTGRYEVPGMDRLRPTLSEQNMMLRMSAEIRANYSRGLLSHAQAFNAVQQLFFELGCLKTPKSIEASGHQLVLFSANEDHEAETEAEEAGGAP